MHTNEIAIHSYHLLVNNNKVIKKSRIIKIIIIEIIVKTGNHNNWVAVQSQAPPVNKYQQWTKKVNWKVYQIRKYQEWVIQHKMIIRLLQMSLMFHRLPYRLLRSKQMWIDTILSTVEENWNHWVHHLSINLNKKCCRKKCLHRMSQNSELRSISSRNRHR